MPDRLSRLLKATLLRRRSTSAVPQDKKAASKAVDSGPSSPPLDHHHHHHHHHDVHQSPAKSRAYSVVSSLPVDHPSSPDEILPGPATPATSCSTDHQGHIVHRQRQYFDSIELDSSSPTSIAVGNTRPDEVVARRGSGSEQQQQKKKRADRLDDSLEPGPTTTTAVASAAPAAADLWQPEQLRSSRLTPPPLQSSDPFGAASPQKSPRPQEREQRPSVVEPKASASSLAPVAESSPPPPPPPSSSEKPKDHNHHDGVLPSSAASPKRPNLGIRKQSLLPASHHHLVSNLLDPTLFLPQGNNNTHNGASADVMPARKIWVRRPGGSPTLVPILEDALVDELRDQVIFKYGNSLGKTFDSPDIVIRIVPRDGPSKPSTPERLLSPEESLASVVDMYFPGGQRVEEALVIDIPPRRTPKPSPRPVYYHNEPAEHDYFSIVPMNPSTPPTHTSNSSVSANAQQTPSISILTTGKAPPLPSPGSTRGGTRHTRRPPALRHATGSPTILNQASKESVSSPVQASQPAPAVPTPPVPPPPESPQSKALTPPARGSSPRTRPSLKDKASSTSPFLNAAFGGLIEGTVPPINVLIVEDNIINQKLLEAFMKRLSVRWKCAGNGEEAVKKWRQGGFHLVLMDIQLPVMNGLDATKEIRRLERLNGIGVFPKTPDGRSSATNAIAIAPEADGAPSPTTEEDTLHDRSLFKSPVIIVALTASSLQSDRHEALAAGCNDFLTKPVGFPWLQQKVTEWGCMQALIDFEGWRRWRGFIDDPAPDSAPDPDSNPAPSSSLAPSPPRTDGHVSPMSTGVARPPSPASTRHGSGDSSVLEEGQ